jgi:hypothetical protein
MRDPRRAAAVPEGKDADSLADQHYNKRQNPQNGDGIPQIAMPEPELPGADPVVLQFRRGLRRTDTISLPNALSMFQCSAK